MSPVPGVIAYFPVPHSMQSPQLIHTVKPIYQEMQLQKGYLSQKWKKARSAMFNAFVTKYRRALQRVKKSIWAAETEVDNERRKSSAKLQPLPDRPIRRVASRLKRRPTDELRRLRKKGENWTANDLFRFQYSDPEAGTPEERRALCYDWLDRLHNISKKYCYLAWYEAAIYACYYRLAPILTDSFEKKCVWHDVRKEYAEIFIMGRRIWRRPTHHSRLRVFYDLAMLCVRFGEVEDDTTCAMFRDLLSDNSNFDFSVLTEVEFAKSIDKVTRLENFVIDQFYPRRRSSGSLRSSFRSRRSLSDRSPSRRSEIIEDAGDAACTTATVSATLTLPPPVEQVTKEVENLTLEATSPPEDSSETKKLLIPSIVISGPSRSSSFRRPVSPHSVRFTETPPE